VSELIKKANGYAIRFYVELDGKSERIYLYEKGWSKADAEAAMVEYRQRSGYLDPNMTVAQYMNKFSDDYVLTTVTLSTAKRYDELIALHITPHIGKIKILDLKPGELQSLYTKLLKKGLSSTTVLKVHRLLHLAFKRAIGWGYMRYNPCDGVKAPAQAKTEIVIPTDEQIQLILEKAQENLILYMSVYIPVYIASTTGMRLGEILGLQNDCADMENKLFLVKQSLNHIEGSVVLKQTKTKGSRRPVPFLPGTEEVLKKYIKMRSERQLKAKKYNRRPTFFIVNKYGEPLHPINTSHWFKKLVKELKLPNGIHFHSLRHYHASWLLRQGIHPKVVQERLGHSTITITLNTYSHLIPNMQNDVISGLQTAIFNTGPKAGTKLEVLES